MILIFRSNTLRYSILIASSWTVMNFMSLLTDFKYKKLRIIHLIWCFALRMLIKFWARFTALVWTSPAIPSYVGSWCTCIVRSRSWNIA